jgi:hypothetical protein
MIQARNLVVLALLGVSLPVEAAATDPVLAGSTQAEASPEVELSGGGDLPSSDLPTPSTPVPDPNTPRATAPGTPTPAAATSGAGAEEPRVEEARERFRRGIGFYQEGDYRLALIEFERAYELVPSYRVLFNIGQVAISLGQFARARIALERYLGEGGAGIDDARRESVQRDLEMLGRRTATIELRAVSPEAEVLIDDRPLADYRVGDTIVLDAGEHRVRVVQKKYLPGERRFTLAGGENLVLAIELNAEPPAKQTRDVVASGQIPRPDSPKTSPTLALARSGSWIATGLLVGSTAATGIVGAIKAAELNELRSKPNPDVDSLRQTADQAHTFLVASDVLLAASGTALAASLFLQFYHPKREARATNTSTIDVMASPSLVGVNMRGRF